jgi:hypothetical protein
MRRHQPALLGGLFIGVLSSLPVVNILNTCCCLWVLVGGVLTAYLQQQRTAEPVEAAEAALGGLIAGLAGAVISVPISAMLTLSGDVQEHMRSLIEGWQMPPDLRDRVIGLMSGPRFVILTAAITVPVYAVFGMLGGLLGSAIFRKKTPPASPTGPAPAEQGPATH